MKRTAIIIGLLAALLGSSSADNVDLVTLPNRSSVQLTIYNSEDVTLAKETRYITLKKGSNKLQFSWAGTLIDPTSVELRPLEHADQIEVADTVFPGQKPQHLIWNIHSRYAGMVKVEVSYFTSGLTWAMDYVSVCNPDETQMSFQGFVRVYNRSGEEYEDAQIRLIVGKINLVEKIADLARRQGRPAPNPQTESARWKDLKQKSARMAFRRADRARKMPAGAKSIVKEGLSEYFMFTVEGSETIRNGWSKRMLALEAERLNFNIVYRMRSYQYGKRPVRFFIWRNDAAHKLGESPLPDGQVRIFRRNGSDGLSYLGQQVIRYVPIKAEIEVNLGADDLVLYETRKRSIRRYNFHFRHNNVNGWDEQSRWADSIRNYRGKPITFELRRIWPGHVDFASRTETTLFDYRTTAATFTVAPRSQQVYEAQVTTHHGSNHKQNRVALKK
ncbi:hypothetical protein JYT15_00100 [Acidimicrobium ferrooxidans]|nr:hypothetical protein [Acidimicrobium ferrooxidans]